MKQTTLQFVASELKNLAEIYRQPGINKKKIRIYPRRVRINSNQIYEVGPCDSTFFETNTRSWSRPVGLKLINFHFTPV